MQAALDTDGVADMQCHQYLVDLARNPEFAGFEGSKAEQARLKKYVKDTIETKPPAAWVPLARAARRSSVAQSWPQVLQRYQTQCAAAAVGDPPSVSLPGFPCGVDLRRLAYVYY